MKTPILVLLITQCCLTATAVVFNSILLLIIWSSKKTKMGNYKYIMNAFTIFEALFAVVCLIGMPMHSISDRTWIEFTSYGVLANTKFAKLGPILYCMMYEIWLGFIILHFMYRYVVLCKSQWVMAIKMNYWLRVSLVLLIIFYVVLCLICSLYLCPYDEPSTKVLNEIKELFDIEANRTIGYYVIRLTTLEGAFSLVGMLALLVHYVGVFGSAIVVAFCSWRIWKTIRKMQAAQQHVNVALERQLFIALLLQTVVPVFLTHLPSMFVLTFPLWEDNVTIGPMSSMFPLFLTITKVVDPIVPLICIRDYRRKFMQFIRCNKYDPVETGAQPTKTISLQRSMSTKSAPANKSYDEICRLIVREGAYELTLFGELVTNL